MQYDKQDTMLAAGFAVVRQYDPALYARMEASDWQVSTDVEPLVRERGVMALWSAMQADGLTDKLSSGEFTFINMQGIRDAAHHEAIPLRYYVAFILAHEFRHTTQGTPTGLTPEQQAKGEAVAFKAGKAFAGKLPAPYGAMLASDSDQVQRAEIGELLT